MLKNIMQHFLIHHNINQLPLELPLQLPTDKFTFCYAQFVYAKMFLRNLINVTSE